jgi:hypothetical protein
MESSCVNFFSPYMCVCACARACVRPRMHSMMLKSKIFLILLLSDWFLLHILEHQGLNLSSQTIYLGWEHVQFSLVITGNSWIVKVGHDCYFLHTPQFSMYSHTSTTARYYVTHVLERGHGYLPYVFSNF